MMRHLLLLFVLLVGHAPLFAQWLTGWSDRQAFYLTENSGFNLSNYQIRLDVTHLQGMSNDFSDIRFTTNNGFTMIDYWIEVTQNATSAVVWVEVPFLGAHSVDSILMYYGNPSAVSASDGQATFIFFDDFTTFSGWNTYGNGRVEHDTTTFPGSSVLAKLGACDPSGGWKSIGTSLSSFRMISREIRVGGGTGCPWNRYGLENSSYNGYSLRRRADQGGTAQVGYERRNGGSASHARNVNVHQPRGVWYRTEMMKDCGTGEIETQIFDDNKYLIGGTAGTDNAYCSFDRIVVRGGRDYFFDYIAIAAHETAMPSISITPPPGIILLSFKLMDFDAIYTKDGNLLSWEVEEETEVDFFKVEYSTNAVDFEVFDEVWVMGDTYSYLDENHRTGKVAYYRLATVLKDGSTEYSNVKAVRLPQKEALFTLAPNPVHSMVQLTFTTERATLMQLLVIDLNGRIVLEKRQDVQEGEQQVGLDLSSLSTGIYHLVLSDGMVNRTRRFIKQ